MESEKIHICRLNVCFVEFLGNGVAITSSHVFGYYLYSPIHYHIFENGVLTPRTTFIETIPKIFRHIFFFHSFVSLTRLFALGCQKIELYCFVVARVKDYILCMNHTNGLFVIVLCPIRNESCTMQTSYYYFRFFPVFSFVFPLVSMS